MSDDGCLSQTITIWMKFGLRFRCEGWSIMIWIRRSTKQTFTFGLLAQGSMCKLRESLNTLHHSSWNKNVIEQTQTSGIWAFLEPIYTLHSAFSLNEIGLMEALAATLFQRYTSEQTKYIWHCTNSSTDLFEVRYVAAPAQAQTESQSPVVLWIPSQTFCCFVELLDWISS